MNQIIERLNAAIRFARNIKGYIISLLIDDGGVNIVIKDEKGMINRRFVPWIKITQSTINILIVEIEEAVRGLERAKK